MNSPLDILRHFSFTQDQAEVYLAILSLEKPGVTDIARKIGKNRTAVYFHIKHLLEKNVIKEARKGRRLRFIAVSAAELAEMFEQSLTDFKSFIPQLESLQRIEQEHPIIEVLESKKGYYKIYDEISSMSKGSTFRIIEGKKALRNELALLTEYEWKTFFERAQKRDIETKGIFTEESLHMPRQLLSKELFHCAMQRIWHMRTLPESLLPFDQLLLIYRDKTAFLFPDIKLTVTIQQKEIASLLRAVFDSLYHFATPITKERMMT